MTYDLFFNFSLIINIKSQEIHFFLNKLILIFCYSRDSELDNTNPIFAVAAGKSTIFKCETKSCVFLEISSVFICREILKNIEQSNLSEYSLEHASLLLKVIYIYIV